MADTDLVLVNPGGRVVEVPNELGQELLANGQFKKATDEQVKELHKADAGRTAEVLAKKEADRVQAAKKAADDYFAKDKADTGGVTVNPANVTADAAVAAAHPITGQATEGKPKSRKA